MFAVLRSFVASAVLGVILIGAGVFTLSTANADAGEYADLAKNGAKVTGIVSNVSQERSTTGTGSKRKVTFYEKMTISYEVESHKYSISNTKEKIAINAGTRVGDAVNLVVDKSNPAHAKVEQTNDNNTEGGRFFGILFLILGVASLAGAGVALLRGLASARQS